MASVTTLWHRTPGDLKAAAIALLAGFFIGFDLTETSKVNGVITACSYVGVGEVVGGAIAAFLGLRVLVASSRKEVARDYRRISKPLAQGLGAAAILLGAILVLKGVGLIFSPCP